MGKSVQSSKAVFIVLVSVIVILAIAIGTKLLRHTPSGQISMSDQVTTPILTQAPTPAGGNASDQQLSQDEKDIQNTLNKLDGDINNIDQSFSNQSADTPIQ